MSFEIEVTAFHRSFLIVCPQLSLSLSLSLSSMHCVWHMVGEVMGKGPCTPTAAPYPCALPEGYTTSYEERGWGGKSEGVIAVLNLLFYSHDLYVVGAV